MAASAGVHGGAAAKAAPGDAAMARIPAYALAVIEALCLQDPSTDGLRRLDEAQWRKALAFCDRSQLTLMLGHIGGDALPGWVRARIDGNAAQYGRRFERLKASLLQIADTLGRQDILFVALKGVTHCPEFTSDPLLRAQGDIDIWGERGMVLEARDALVELGYRPIGASRGRHLRPLIREEEWKWTGDYFAADLPIAVELHFELWDGKSEFIDAMDEQELWNRRTTADFEGRALPVLALPDMAAFAALHLLMHVLHGDLRLQRAWELANFLERRADDAAFWSSWRELHRAPLRRLEATVFALAAGWFRARLAPEVAEEIARLPDDVRLWIERYSLSPLEGLFHSNKDEIWLQLALLDSRRGKWRVFLRRTFPARLPPGGTRGSGASAAAETTRRLMFLATRLAHHLRAAAPTLLGAVRWNWRRTRLGGGFLRFQIATAPFNFGVVVFLVLHNLYLLSLGFHEDTIGRIVSAMTLGTFAGALPAAALARRLGLRGAVLTAIGGVALAEFARAWFQTEPWQIASAFANGLALAAWGVAYSPAIAALSGEQNRQFAFSLSCFAGIVVCAFAGIAGGALPGFLQAHFHLAGIAGAERGVLLMAPCVVALAAVPLLGLRIPVPAPVERRSGSGGRFLLPFLAVIALWTAASGAFNPFFNAYFSVRLGLGAGRIGAIYSVSQIVLAASLLATPALFRRLGAVRGIALLQLAAGGSMLLLAGARGAYSAAAAYVALKSFQYMAEPGILTTLMNRVTVEQRSRASALFLAATALASSLATLAAGTGISRFGYPAMLVVSAIGAGASAVLFRMFVSGESES